MKKLIIFMLALTTMLILSACSDENSDENSDSNDEEIVLKIGHTMIEDSTRNAGAEKMKEYIDEHSDGRIKVEIYPNSQLGSSKEQIEGVQTGSIEMAIFPSTSATDFQPIFTLMDIPFLMPTEIDKNVELYETEAFNDFMATGDDVGLKVLSSWFEGFGTIASKEAVTKPDDFNNLNFRIIGGDISREHYETLGSKIEVISFSEVYTSLQTGRINTIDIPIHQLYDNKFYEVVENITTTSHWSLHDFVMVNKDWFDGIPADLQDIVTEAAKEAAPYAVDKLEELTDSAKQEMIDSGVNFLEPTDELTEEMKSIGEELEQKYIDENGDKGEEILTNLKKEIEELN